MADFANLVVGLDTSALKRGERDIQSFGGSAKKSFNAVALAAGAALGAFVSLGSAVRIIADFESSISRLGAVSRATGSELKSLRDIAKELGSTTEFSASQAADGLNFLAMAGFNAAEAMAAIPAVLDLATASQMGLAEAADTASNIMSGFGISANNAAQVADVLAAASTRANTTVGQLGSAMSTVAPIAKALDISLSDTAAAIGVLSDAGIQGERAGTALRGVLASLAGPTSEAEKVLKGLGLTLSDVDPAANDLSVVMARLGDAGLSTADAMTLFGREAASGALVLIDGANRVGEFGDELDRVDGAAKTMAATMRDNLGGDLKGVISAAEGLAIALGDAGLTAVIRAVVQSITGLVRGLTAVAENAKILGVVILTLAATQIPALVTGFVALTAGMTATGIATTIFTSIVTAARIALIALGGPLGLVYGILGAGATAWVLWGDNAKEGETAAYDAALGTKELNSALRKFSQDVTPAAAASAIDMANSNHELAKSAFDAARGELAKARAVATAGNALLDANPLTAGGDSGYSIAMAQNAATALAQVSEAERQLALAEGERKRAVTMVTGALSEQMTQTIATTSANSKLEISLDASVSGLSNVSAGAVAAASSIEELTPALTDAEKAAQSYASTMQGFVVDGIGKAVDNMVDGFTGGLKSIKDIFVSTIKQMIAFAIKNKIMLSLGMGGSAMGTAASAATGGAGMLGSIGSFAGSIGTGASVTMNGLMTGGGFSPMMGAIRGGLGAGGAAGIGTAIGAALPVIGAVVAGLTLLSSIGAKRAAKRLEAATNANNAALENVEKEHNARVLEMTTRLQANADATQALIQSLQTLAEMEQEREQAARAILNERANLEIELLRLQNDTVALREREIAATEPVNRQLRRFILAMGDAAEAIEAQRRAVEGLASAGRGIVEFVRGITGQAQLSFRQDLALAQGGDVGASGRITESAQGAIDQARSQARTGLEVDRFIAQTATSLLALPAVATFEEMQIDLLDEISSGIGDLTKLQSDTQQKMMRAINDGFFTIDSNLDGKLTFAELQRGLGDIATDQELRAIFGLLDKNQDSVIDEFEKIISGQDVNNNSLASVIKNGFGLLDTNLDGKLTFDELKRGLGHIATDQELRAIFGLLDKNQDSVIDEFEKIISGQDVNNNSLASVIKNGFDLLDSNLDGKLTFAELQRGLGHIATDAQLRSVFNAVDANGSGTIDRLESLGGSNENIDENTLFAAREALNQLSELKLIAGETANNTRRVMNLTTAIQDLILSQRLSAQSQVSSLEAQRAAAQKTLTNAQNAISGTPSTVVLQSRKKGFLGIGSRPEIRGANPTFIALEADIRRAQEELAYLDAQLRAVPRFAAGGSHMGGARIVGERGPELEFTGPSQIHSNANTMQMLSNAPVVSELKELRREMAAMRDEQRQLGIQTARNTDRTYRVLREFDVIGLPPERPA